MRKQKQKKDTRVELYFLKKENKQCLHKHIFFHEHYKEKKKPIKKKRKKKKLFNSRPKQS